MTPASRPPRTPAKSDKTTDLAPQRHDGARLTTDQGVPIGHTDDSLRAGLRGPSLLEDTHLREKITRFDHERIPERVVHARGAAAHGYFQVYAPLTDLTRAQFLQDPSVKTPVFVRFSTVGGSRGSADTARDVRGFATKFYTEEGNFDLVGNNMPVFFIQDGIKFPDFVHAVKPEPHNEIPQASSAHDNLWDFVSLVPETAHMVMWLMSDRAIPLSYRTMEGFGVHTFRMVNAAGASHLVKFHWKPVFGVHSLLWDEAQKLAGLDPDFHRRDLWDSIERGVFPEYELGVQIMDELQATSLGFDLLDPTKLVPEEVVPIQRIGKMVLNRNPDNYFAETEQVAFHVGNLVSGIEVTNDPLMQARLFSYVDTQLTRLGGPNFAELPINRPLAPVHNHQQDGFGRMTVPVGRANYHPNSTGGGCPFLASPKEAYATFPELVAGAKTRTRSETFNDHFSQATMFYRSLSPVERQHLIDACRFEVAKVEKKEIRERVIHTIFMAIDPELAVAVATSVGVDLHGAQGKPATETKPIALSSALSMHHATPSPVAGRRVAMLVAGGFSSASAAVKKRLEDAGVAVHVIAPGLGPVRGNEDGAHLDADRTFATASSVMFDAVYVPGGEASVDALVGMKKPVEFVREAFLHCKTIAATGEGAELVDAALPDGEPRSRADGVLVDDGGKLSSFTAALLEALAVHRHWSRARVGV